MKILRRTNARGVGPGPTSGWIEDRGLPFSPYVIEMALRKLHDEGDVIRTTDGGFVYWSVPDDMPPRPPKRNRFKI